MEFRLLNADEIEARIGTVKKGVGFSLLLYKDARCDMARLDEKVGAMNWQRDHKELKGVMYCGVAINRNYEDDTKPVEWIWKWDAGAESNTEKEKGESSDSFKRACVCWGIGRELYTAPFIWVYGDVDKNIRYEVKSIHYNSNREIDALEIVDQKSGKQIFSLKNGHTESVSTADGKASTPKRKASTSERPQASTEHAPTKKEWQDKISEYAQAHDMTTEEICRDYHIGVKTPVERLQEVYAELTSAPKEEPKQDMPDFAALDEKTPFD